MLTIDLYDAEKSRFYDKKTIESGVSETELIRRAGKKLSEVRDYNGKTAILCGYGNNGGDGLALACALIKKGKKMSEIGVFCFGKDKEICVSDGAKPFLAELCESGLNPVLFYEKPLTGYDTIVDCIFGTGLKREVTGVFERAIEEINSSGAFVISADVPSGLNSDNGRIMGSAVKADVTVSFACYKQGCFLNDAKDCVGNLTLVDVGIECAPSSVKKVLKVDLASRRENSHKNDYGKLLIVGGSKNYSGAPMLAALGCAALRSGSGLVGLCVPECVYSAVAAHNLLATFCVMPDDGCVIEDSEIIMPALKKADAVAFGMGISRGDEVIKLLRRVLENHKKVIIDADGLWALAQDLSVLKQAAGEVLITPHPKEFSLLSGFSVEEILNDPIKTSREFSEKYGVKVLLKGVGATITDGKISYITDRGSSGQAKGGSGDVLSGVIGGLAAQGMPLMEAAVDGAYIAGVAGGLAAERFGARSALPTDTVDFIPQAIRNCTEAEVESATAVKRF